MLEHLLHAKPEDFIPIAKATPGEEVTARYNTVKLLEDPDEDELILQGAQAQVAREAFLALTSGQSDKEKKEALAKLDVPEAVKELVGMLTAYDWAFVEQAKELRGYTVAKITEETTHPDARIRLKALELLGKVTEVALFTERSEVKHVQMSDTELDQELKSRLEKYIALEKEVQGEKIEDQTENLPQNTNPTP